MSDDPLIIDRGLKAGTVVLLTVLFSTATTAAVFFGLHTLYTPGAVEVPAISGMQSSGAREVLDGKGLLLVLDAEREDAAVAAGGIVAQLPLPGSKVRSGSEIHATVSRGWTRVKIPDAAGLPVDKAARLLGSMKLAVGGEDKESNEAAAGTVLGTNPAAGVEVSPGAEVRLRVSSGPNTVDVPKVTGMNVKKAKETLEAAKFKIGTTKYDFDEDKWPYSVLKQTPEAGAKVAPGATVDLVVNQGD